MYKLKNSFCIQNSDADNTEAYPSGVVFVYIQDSSKNNLKIGDDLAGWIFDKTIYENNNSDVVSMLGKMKIHFIRIG